MKETDELVLSALGQLLLQDNYACYLDGLYIPSFNEKVFPEKVHS
jgi:hypothetical protein